METTAVFNPTYYENRYKLSASELVNHTTQPLIQFCVKLQEGINLVTRRVIQEKRAQTSQMLIRSFIDSNMMRITDEQLTFEITLNSARTINDYDNLIKLAVQSYAMFLAITNSRKTKLCIDVPPYVTFFRRMTVAFIRGTLNQCIEETQEVDLKSACKSGKIVSEELQNLVNAEISATVPLDRLIKQQFDTVSACDEEQNNSSSNNNINAMGVNPNEHEHVSFEPTDGDPMKTLMADGDATTSEDQKGDLSSDIFEGNTIDALSKDIQEEIGEKHQISSQSSPVISSGTPSSSLPPPPPGTLLVLPSSDNSDNNSSPGILSMSSSSSPTKDTTDMTEPKTTILISDLSVRQLADILREPHKYIKSTDTSLSLISPLSSSSSSSSLSSSSSSSSQKKGKGEEEEGGKTSGVNASPQVMTLGQLKQEKKRHLMTPMNIQEMETALNDDITTDDIIEGKALNTVIAKQHTLTDPMSNDLDDTLVQPLHEYIDANYNHIGSSMSVNDRDEESLSLPTFETI